MSRVLPFPSRGAMTEALCPEDDAPGVTVPRHVLAALDVLVAIGLMVLMDLEHDDAIRDALAERASGNLTVH